MTSAAVHESVEAEPAAPGVWGQSSPTPAAIDGLRAASLRRMPQPEAIGPVLDRLFQLK
jgi:hypothetical protein